MIVRGSDQCKRASALASIGCCGGRPPVARVAPALKLPRILVTLWLTLGFGVVGACARPRVAPAAGPHGVTGAARLRPQAGGIDEGPLGPMGPLRPSAEAARLAALGIVPHTLVQATPTQRDEIMRSFRRSLGVACNFCHAADDYDRMTPRVAVAVTMWTKFARRMRRRDGSPLYCDSCHNGTAVFLRRDRSDRASLLRVMEEYTREFVLLDGRPVDCASCHGQPFNPRFLPRLNLAEDHATLRP